MCKGSLPTTYLNSFMYRSFISLITWGTLSAGIINCHKEGVGSIIEIKGKYSLYSAFDDCSIILEYFLSFLSFNIISSFSQSKFPSSISL